METKYLTVSALNKYIKHRFDIDDHLKNVFLKGEISNLKPHNNGHMYFTLKDETSRISAVMFNNSSKRLTFNPQDGQKVLIIGRVSVYEGTGQYQIYVDDMQEDGLGNLHLAFEKLKEKLAEEGLFDPKHKKEIPRIPTTIGIITAPTGAAIKDILSTLKRRFKAVDTIIFPSLVQGDSAAVDIVKNINLAQTYNLDVIILGRGGGSIEDLWPFNEEIVARAIYNSKIPIISAVGHEIDYTISDFVADLRAPTPTGAAELAVPNYIDVLNQIEYLKIRSSKMLLNQISNYKTKTNNLSNHYILKNPANMYQNKKIEIDNYIEHLNNKITNIINIKKNNLELTIKSHILKNPLNIIINSQNLFNNYNEKLTLLNPLNTLKRGYTIVKKDNIAISTVKSLNNKDLINVVFNDGEISANVIDIKKN
jgi:exodeoxyribonuclease VII large subunit